MPNYHMEMEKQLLGIPKGTPLLLHVCCAPCATVAIERLGGHFALTLFYYNPNIMPKDEYEKRGQALEALAAAVPTAYPMRLIKGEYDNGAFLRVAQGLAGAPEGGARCEECFALRLNAAARQATAEGIAWFATTLTTGPRKNAALINTLGGKVAQAQGLHFLQSDLKKQDGYKRSIELCRQYGIYRQHYCGCVFSAAQDKA